MRKGSDSGAPRPLSCVACLANAQLLESGIFDDSPEITELVEQQAHGGDAEVIFKGESLCVRHFNVKRSWPALFPHEALPAAAVAGLRASYERILGVADDVDDEPRIMETTGRSETSERQ